VSEAVEPTVVEEEKRTGYLELFFDLVFVFAFTQVTAMVVDDTSAAGLGRAALVFALVWWAWSAFAWLTNAIDVENVGTRLFVFAAMLAAFFVALAVPDAYTDEGAWFAVAYFAVRVLHVALYLWGVRADPVQRVAVGRLAPWFLIAPTIALAGGFADDPWRTTLWTISIAIDVVGTLFARGFRVSASHFAERYGLIVIIALGESIVAIGLAALELERDATFALAVAVSFAGAAAAWWAYFDFTQLAVERALHAAPEEKRGHLARDLYTFFHYPIVLGIVFLAVAAKKTLAGPGEPLPDGGRASLALGFSLFLLGFVLARYRVIRRIAWERVGAALFVVAAVVLLDGADALLLLTLSVLALAAALALETFRLRETRARLKQAHAPH
jgi:low temperature requirement protein LtrA